MTIFFRAFKSIKKRSQSKILVDGLYGTIHTPYAVFSDDMYDGITEVKKQVKDTTMILNSIASGDNVCASADYQKNRGKILDTGISLYEYMESILHMENP